MSATNISAIWLAIFRAQKPLRYEQVCELVPDLAPNQLHPALSMSYRLGYFERAGKRLGYTYAVTPRCNVPPGIRVLDVLEAANEP